jgi:arylsulfatase A-like enzyme
MIVRWPKRIKSSSRTSALIQTHEFAHTCVDVAGAKALPWNDGRSLAPLLFDQPGRTD